MRTRALLLLACGNALAWGVGSGLFFNLSSITHEAGLPTDALAPYLYTSWAICRAAGMAASGYMLDHFQPRLLLCAGLLLASCGILVLSPPVGVSLTPKLAIVFGVLHGTGNGCTSLVFRAAPAIFFGRTHVGAIGGLLSMLNVGSTAIGPLLVGASFDLLGTYAPCVRGIALASATMAIVCLGMHRPVKPSSGGAGEELGRADCVSDGPDPPKDSALELVADPDAAPTPSTDSALLAGEELDSSLPSVHQDAVAVAMEEPCANDIVAESPEKLDPACSRMKRSSTRKPMAYAKLQ